MRDLTRSPPTRKEQHEGSTDPADPLLSDLVFKGHTFRMQFMVHDGDQNKTGGDVGQNCTIVSIPQSQ